MARPLIFFSSKNLTSSGILAFIDTPAKGVFPKMFSYNFITLFELQVTLSPSPSCQT